MDKLKVAIEEAYQRRASVKPGDAAEAAVREAVAGLDSGTFRIAEKTNGGWRVNTWLKKAVLLYFRIEKNRLTEGGDGKAYDKVLLKFADWKEKDFAAARIRAVPGALVRFGAFIGRDVVLMPSFVNIGAYVGAGTMVDTWATVGSCAQIGENVHIAGGAGIGGVLEPVQAEPVIVEDDCFIGARSQVAEGVLIGEGAVLAMGVMLGASTPIVERETGKVGFGEIPPYAVVVPGTLPPKKKDAPATAAAVIVKRVNAKTRARTSINDLLRP